MPAPALQITDLRKIYENGVEAQVTQFAECPATVRAKAGDAVPRYLREIDLVVPVVDHDERTIPVFLEEEADDRRVGQRGARAALPSHHNGIDAIAVVAERRVSRPFL